MILKNPEDINKLSLNLQYAKSARAGWKHLLCELKIEDPFKILLPGYIGQNDKEGSGVFDPIRISKTPYEFYSVDERLRFNLNAIEATFAEGQIKLMLVIHYFGFCQNEMIPLKNLCEKYGVILVEDCAHAYNLFQGKNQLGEIGDFSFYSLHKFFSTRSGGILRINNPRFTLPDLPAAETCDEEVLLQLLKTDTQAIAEKRIENYNYLYEKLENVKQIERMYKPEEGIIPHDFPVIVKNGLREKVYFSLMEKGVPTIALYYRMVDVLDPTKFPISFGLAKSILNFPVHQDTEKEDLDFLVTTLENVLVELGV